MKSFEFFLHFNVLVFWTSDMNRLWICDLMALCISLSVFGKIDRRLCRLTRHRFLLTFARWHLRGGFLFEYFLVPVMLLQKKILAYFLHLR